MYSGLHAKHRLALVLRAHIPVSTAIMLSAGQRPMHDDAIYTVTVIQYAACIAPSKAAAQCASAAMDRLQVHLAHAPQALRTCGSHRISLLRSDIYIGAAGGLVIQAKLQLARW